MATYIRIETKEDLEWLQKLLDNSVARVKDNDMRLVDIAENVLRVHDALHSPISEKDLKKYAAAVKVEPEIPKIDPNFCKDHKTYGAVKPPRTDCSTCWEQYKKFHPLEYDKALKKFQMRQEAAA